VRGLGDRLESIPGRFADVERRIDAIAGGSFGARNEWLVAEAVYYLGVANSELQLGGRWNNALAALRLADERLREVGDPGLAGVREQIAEEILALESVRLVDIEGLAHSLSRLAARIGELPLRAAAVDGGAQSEDGAQEEPGLGRLWSSIENAFSDIVRVERRDDAALAVLTAQEQRLIARQLSVELQTARLALVSGEAGLFSASLEHAAALLREDFDSNDPAVEGGLRLVDSLLELDVAPPLPDISRSLAMLRARGEP
jgi:uroporphyrin-3 C-methyltransferase